MQALLEKTSQKKALDRQAEEHALRDRIGSDDDDSDEEPISFGQNYVPDYTSPTKRSKTGANSSKVRLFSPPHMPHCLIDMGTQTTRHQNGRKYSLHRPSEMHFTPNLGTMGAMLSDQNARRFRLITKAQLCCYRGAVTSPAIPFPGSAAF